MSKFQVNEIAMAYSSGMNLRGLVKEVLTEDRYKVLLGDGTVDILYEFNLRKLRAAGLFGLYDYVRINDQEVVRNGQEGRVVGVDYNGFNMVYRVKFPDGDSYRYNEPSLLLSRFYENRPEIKADDEIKVANSRYDFLYEKRLVVKEVVGNVLIVEYKDKIRFLYKHEVVLAGALLFKPNDMVRVRDFSGNGVERDFIGMINGAPDYRDSMFPLTVDGHSCGFYEHQMEKLTDEQVWKVNNHVNFHGTRGKILSTNFESNEVTFMISGGLAMTKPMADLIPLRYIEDDTAGLVERMCEQSHVMTPINKLIFLYGYGFVCEDYANSHSRICADCGTRISNLQYPMRLPNGGYLCQQCSRNYATCNNCGDVHRIEELEDGLCSVCHERYTNCSRCGRLEQRDRLDEEGLCHRCQDKYIMDYYFKPNPNFFGEATNKKFLGMEWEISGGGENHYNAKKVLGGKKELYAKHDGSVRNGFEVVTHPMSINYHLNEFDWEGVMKQASALSYKGNAGNGVHVHVSRAFFGRNRDEQAEPIANLIYFVEKNWNDLLLFANRNEEEAAHWSNRYVRGGDDYSDYSPMDIYRMASCSGNRYRTINLCNEQTVEIRIFRSSVQWPIVKGYLQFVDVITEMSLDKDLGGNYGFKEVAEKAEAMGYRELVRLIAQRLPNAITA